MSKIPLFVKIIFVWALLVYVILLWWDKHYNK